MLVRKLGKKYPLSFGTAGIFEGEYADPSKWSNLMYVNIRTLYRNYVSSYDAKDYYKINEEEFNQTFMDEVAEFERLVKEVTNNRVKTIFYYPKYTNLKKTLPHLERDQYNPSIFDDVEENLWEDIQSNQKWVPFNIEIIDENGFEQSFLDVTMFTSFVVDLLQSVKFNTLTLLESYTGKLKKRQEWYTKLKLPKRKDTAYKVPFNKFTLQIYGDKSGFFKTTNKQMRDMVTNMAIDDNWLPISTLDRIRASIKKLKGYDIKELLYSYL
nr:MAG TPA: hypothetical protein [Caudoviricetes sp.]